MPTVSVKTVGVKGSLVPEFGMPDFPDASEDDGPLLLRDLIARIVRTELAAFEERRNERQFLKVLTERQIADGRETGRIGDSSHATAAPPNPDLAVAVALEAFEDGTYLVAIDGAQRTGLDEPVDLAMDSKITFIRLVSLAGG